MAHQSDQTLVAGVRAGDLACIRTLSALAERTIWPTVIAVVGEGQAFQSFPAIITALSDNGFQRLAGYDGRSSLATYLVLVTRDLLGEEVQRLLDTDYNRAWRRFLGIACRDRPDRIRRARETAANAVDADRSPPLLRRPALVLSHVRPA